MQLCLPFHSQSSASLLGVFSAGLFHALKHCALNVPNGKAIARDAVVLMNSVSFYLNELVELFIILLMRLNTKTNLERYIFNLFMNSSLVYLVPHSQNYC